MSYPVQTKLSQTVRVTLSKGHRLELSHSGGAIQHEWSESKHETAESDIGMT